ncbi:MAG TPA: class I SAM-dependent rRNA methyltransferase [Nevskiaceae bacterium]
MVSIRLKPHEDRRLRAGHLWIYSNEVDTGRTPLQSVVPGSVCRVEDARGAPLGLASVNPHALLCARLLTRRADAVIDEAWLLRRLQRALRARTSVYSAPFYRLVYGEGDGLPGLVVDRYGDYLAVQLNTAGMEVLRGAILSALHALLQPRGIVLRNDSPARNPEGLPLYDEVVGEVPAEVELREGDTTFKVSLRSGQKTGWFFDQRDNRDRLQRYAHGARVLDVCCYTGAWALRALAAGAKSACAVDSSAEALAAVRANAELNGTGLEARRGRALEVLEQLHAEHRQYDLVVVDPPALVKRRRDHAPGLAHYRRLNQLAIRLLAPGGVLVSCSCSFHVTADELQQVLLRASTSLGRRLVILEQGGPGPDHPVHPAIPETRYLKAFFCRAGG